jgi:hypothetical protein
MNGHGVLLREGNVCGRPEFRGYESTPPRRLSGSVGRRGENSAVEISAVWLLRSFTLGRFDRMTI